MNATQPIGVDPPGGGPPGDEVRRQLDALASGQCDHVTFLNAMKDRFRFEPDENWEVLSLLDQYYRRGKIPLDVFRAIKNGFAEYILGPQVVKPALHTVATIATPAPPSPAAAPVAAAAPTAVPAHPTAPTLAPPPTFTGIPSGLSMAATAANAAKTQAGSAREVRVGEVLRDRYRVEAVVARGGSGTVLEVSDANRLNLPPIGKRLAVKVPRTPDPRGNFQSQLRHEFHQLQHLSHPNIVRVFDFDRDAGLAFFTMEMLHGVHLTQVLEAKNGRALPRAHALAIIRDLSSAIAYAHGRGVAHGDVNPQNVFITSAGEVRLLGFGAAHKMSAAVPTPEFERATAASDTHRYASCEVFEGNRPDAQDDIYSLSCVAYLLIRGKHPYAGATSIEARAGHLRPRRPAGLSYQQWRMLRAGLRTDAKKRPGTAQEWIDAMELGGAAPRVPPANELIEAPGDKPRRFHLVAAAAAIAVLIGLGYWFSISGDSPTFPPTASEPAAESLAQPPRAPLPGAPLPGSAPEPANATAVGAPSAGAGPGNAPPPTAITPQRTSPAPATAVTDARATSGPARIEMVSDTLDVLPTDTVVHVTVRRKGNLHGVASFTWWTESGTAKPGSDFSPVLPHVQQMQDGESSAVLTVPLLATLRAQPKSFYVGIESGDGGAQIGARALTQITLPPTD
jgi:serine/threonine protein kinase